MKKIITIMALSAISMLCFAQNNVQQAAADAAEAIANAPQAEPAKPKPVYWTESADLNIGFNQTGLTNWAAGGYNTMNLSAGLDAKANYKKALMSCSTTPSCTRPTSSACSRRATIASILKASGPTRQPRIRSGTIPPPSISAPSSPTPPPNTSSTTATTTAASEKGTSGRAKA